MLIIDLLDIRSEIQRRSVNGLVNSITLIKIDANEVWQLFLCSKNF